MQSEREKAAHEQQKMEEVARSFNTAMKGAGTDEDRIIRELIAYNNRQRQIIKAKYLTLYGKKLVEDLKDEINGNFLEAVLGLLTPLDDFEAAILNKAITGDGTDARKIIEILCSKDAAEVAKIKEAYRKLYHRELESDLEEEEGGDLGRIFRSLAAGGRGENHGFDQELVKKEAQELYDAGQGRVGTDEGEFVRIFCSRSFPQLSAIFTAYKQICDTDILEAVTKNFSGNLELAISTMVKCVRSKPIYFAELLRTSMEGAGTRERDLLQILIRRCDLDLPEIKQEYKRMYNKTLYDDVKSEVEGDFQKLLLALIGKN